MVKKHKGQKITMSQYIVVGPEGAALQVDREKFIDEWFEVPNSVPHVSLYVSKNCVSKDLRRFHTASVSRA